MSPPPASAQPRRNAARTKSWSAFGERVPEAIVARDEAFDVAMEKWIAADPTPLAAPPPLPRLPESPP